MISNAMAQRYLERKVNRLMRQEGWPTHLGDILQKIKSGFFERPYVDMLFQKWARYREVNIYDAYAFTQFHSLLNTGRVVRITLQVGECPHRDKRITENNNALSYLPSPFVGEFWGGTQGADGNIEWNEPIVGEIMSWQEETLHRTYLEVKPGFVPLEVGITSAAKTLVQLQTSGIARWPYHSTVIEIYLPTEHLMPTLRPIEYAEYMHAHNRARQEANE